MDESCTQLLSSDPMINLNTMVFFFLYSFPFARNLHNLEPLALEMVTKKHRCKSGKSNTHKSTAICTHTTKT
jgi:hypothetical protein